MRNKILTIVLLIPLLAGFGFKSFGAQAAQAQPQTQVVTSSREVKIEAKKLDPRALILRDYLAKYDSPLQYQAQDFIDAADTYDIDYKLVPAIAGVESTFGKAIPGGYNAWGWGVYGDQAIYFDSWRNGIFTVSQGLKQNYIDKGLTDPYTINRVYAASPAWGAHVTYFLNDLNKFEANYNHQLAVNQLPLLVSFEQTGSAKLAPVKTQGKVERLALK